MIAIIIMGVKALQLAAISGQPGVAKLLSSYLEVGQLSHAYLFFGPTGVGKLRVAKAFASDILAASHPQTPHLIASGQHPDYLQVQKEAAVIRIEDIRNMEKWLYQKPYWGQRRVVVINEAHYLNRESGNALLKTLEEPPAYAIIILVADTSTLLPTIVSRCQPVRFGPLSADYIKRVLVEGGAEEQPAALAAAMAEGSLTTASLLMPREPEEILLAARQLLADFRCGKGQAVILQAEAMEKDAEYRWAFYAGLRYLLMAATRGQENGLTIKPELARQVLIKMDEHRRLERVNASQLFLSLDLLWQLYEVVKSA